MFCLGAILAATAISPATTQPSNELHQWSQNVFLGVNDKQDYAEPTVVVTRQDHGTFRFGQSVRDTPLCLAGKQYKRGIGTHAVSEVRVMLPKPGGRFEAIVGVDDNYDTGGLKGTVEFVIESNGKELYRSGIRKGSDPALPIQVELGTAKSFTLKVLDGGDGPGWDQADWIEPKVIQKDKTLWLDEFNVANLPVMASRLPFSLKANGESVTDWKLGNHNLSRNGNITTQKMQFVSERTKLEATIDLTEYKGYEALDWTMHLKNLSDKPSPLITELRPLQLSLQLPNGETKLHGIAGSNCNGGDFVPYAETIGDHYQKDFMPGGGRSSEGIAPFFNLEWKDGGLITAIGWTGQWLMNLHREGAVAGFSAGQQYVRFKLNPGEEVRTPRILLLKWSGNDRIVGHNQFRRLMVEHISQKVDGKAAVPAISENTWLLFNEGNSVNEKNQLETIQRMAGLGIEAYWLDAGWFKGGWPAGAGNWDPREDGFPNGLKPLADAAHKMGMKFILWFEPERVVRNSPIFKEHREWVLEEGGGDTIFNLGDPEARKWITEFFLERFKKWDIDVYRNDYNIDPLRFWLKHDAPDRQGISEIRYIEGLYKMWDDFRAGKPGLTIDNCASGGRRIDIEMIARSYPLWQSDVQCFPGQPAVWDQDETLGLNLYVPLHAGGAWSFEPYRWRSIAGVGASICYLADEKVSHRSNAKKMIAEAKRLRPYGLGDFYPLITSPQDTKFWAGWQFDRPDLGEGYAVFFRREDSPFLSISTGLRGIDPKAKYKVEFVDEGKTINFLGSDLIKLTIGIDQPAKSVLIVYRKLKS